jgi:hypothetical protein
VSDFELYMDVLKWVVLMLALALVFWLIFGEE